MRKHKRIFFPKNEILSKQRNKLIILLNREERVTYIADKTLKIASNDESIYVELERKK